ncbi:glycosyltransferase [uncultured Psychroserpens sp.]|uniref:glycosyltransferase n=1 Tax=uncultured Psychroserpens sp. TaxID=255436 RepID=UPI00260583B2|nr:glycosyltransferase [uncultured Psychroserpens sp.]
MKILLIGEYSRLHNSLKEGLTAIGHDVTLIADGDGFKDYPVDIKIKNKYKRGFGKFIKRLVYKLFKIDLNSLAIRQQFETNKPHLVGYDIVQLINENAFKTVPSVEKRLLEFIFQNNKSVFLLSCGCDFPSVQYAFAKKFKYSVLTPFFENKVSKKAFFPVLKYMEESYVNLHTYIYKNIQGVIASDMDYHLPLEHHAQYLGFIPNPVNTEKIVKIDNPIDDKIVIFHGINTDNYYKKGNDIFEKALDIISKNYANKVNIITTRNIPYSDYLNHYKKAHILLDMVYAYDQGYNALEAMAAGKVVFTGAEQEWLEYYNLKKNTVVINAEPEIQSLVEQLEWLINNPEQIGIISKNARRFIEDKHNYINIAHEYVTLWTQRISKN